MALREQLIEDMEDILVEPESLKRLFDKISKNSTNAKLCYENLLESIRNASNDELTQLVDETGFGKGFDGYHRGYYQYEVEENLLLLFCNNSGKLIGFEIQKYMFCRVKEVLSSVSYQLELIKPPCVLSKFQYLEQIFDDRELVLAHEGLNGFTIRLFGSSEIVYQTVYISKYGQDSDFEDLEDLT